MLNRGGRTITSICEEAFVLLGTGAKWISEAQGKADSSNRKSSRISVQAQIKAVNAVSYTHLTLPTNREV